MDHEAGGKRRSGELERRCWEGRTNRPLGIRRLRRVLERTGKSTLQNRQFFMVSKTYETFPTKGFLKAERALIESKGWVYDSAKGAYRP